MGVTLKDFGVESNTMPPVENAEEPVVETTTEPRRGVSLKDFGIGQEVQTTVPTAPIVPDNLDMGEPVNTPPVDKSTSTEPEVFGFTSEGLDQEVEKYVSPKRLEKLSLGTPSGVKSSDFNLSYDKPTFIVEGKDSFINIYDIFDKHNNIKYLQDEIIADDELMEVVYQSLEAKFPRTGALGKISKGAQSLIGGGGATGGSIFFNRDYRKMPRKKAFEIWQNYMRAFDAANAAVVGEELLHSARVDDVAKRKLAGGYILFNQMDQLYGGERKNAIGDIVDGTVDYTLNSVLDLSTLVSLGLGKLFGYASSKTTGIGIKKLMTAVYENAIKKGATKKAASIAVGNAIMKSTPMASADAALAFGLDYGRQTQLIDVGAQDKYSKAEGAFTAAGSIIFPLAVGLSATVKELRKSPIVKKYTVLSYENIDKMIKKYSPQEAWGEISKALTKKGLFKSVDNQFGVLTAKGKINFLPWENAKAKGQKKLQALPDGGKRRDLEAHNAFFKFFWFGDPDNGVKGYFEALEESGFVMHPKLKEALKEGDQNITGVFAETMNFITPAKMNQIIKKFEEGTGYDLYEFKSSLDPTTAKKGAERQKALVTQKENTIAFFKNNSNLAGQTLWISSELSRLTKAGYKNKDIMKLYKKTQSLDGPKQVQAGLSMYKRLVTSHFSTTGANLQGFNALVTLNTAADFVTGAIDFARLGVAKTLGTNIKTGVSNKDTAETLYNRVYGAWGGSLRRLTDAISPDIPVEYADAILNMNPKIMEKLFRDISGDGGVNDTMRMFNLDGETYQKYLKEIEASQGRKVAAKIESLLWKGADYYTKGVQTITFARLQDNLTKRWAFGTNLGQGIMKKYGITPEEFFSDPKVEFKMATPEFKLIMEQAANRTMRETASVNWSTLPGTTYMRAAARGVEYMTNKTPIGFAIPFGSFLNTTVATAGDLSGVNFLKFGFNKAVGGSLDPVTEDGAELLSKAIVGWTVVGYGVNGQVPGLEEYKTNDNAVERIKGGLNWKQSQEARTGQIRNREFDWPISTMRITSQIIAHGLIETNSEDMSMKELGYRLLEDKLFKEKFLAGIPKELYRDLAVQVGPGQAVRDFDMIARAIKISGEKLKDGDVTSFAYMLIGGSASKIAGGFTRHLDPVNTGYGLYNNMDMNLDLRQGNKFFNQGNKYLNFLTEQKGWMADLVGAEQISEMERRAYPTTGYASGKDIDLGKQFGLRYVKDPTFIDMMLNSAGKQPYQISKINWGGPAKVKNYMDGLLAPQLQIHASLKYQELKSQDKDYFKMNQSDKEDALSDIFNSAVNAVNQQMDSGGIVPKSFSLVRDLSKERKKTEEVLSMLPFEFKKIVGIVDLPFDEKMEAILDREDGYEQLLKIKHLVDTYDDWSKTYNKF